MSLIYKRSWGLETGFTFGNMTQGSQRLSCCKGSFNFVTPIQSCKSGLALLVVAIELSYAMEDRPDRGRCKDSSIQLILGLPNRLSSFPLLSLPLILFLFMNPLWPQQFRAFTKRLTVSPPSCLYSQALYSNTVYQCLIDQSTCINRRMQHR